MSTKIPYSKRSLSADIARVSRQLTNPDIRVPLRADFPPVIAIAEESILPRLIIELAKCGETLESVGEINLICPQKDPDAFPDHDNTALPAFRKMVQKLKAELRECRPGQRTPKVIRHNAIGELVHLDRSRGRPVLHSLTNRQIFTLNAARDARQPTAFTAEHAQAQPHYFVLFDWHIGSGTTLANLASFITHNGGHVLAASSLYLNWQLVPAPKHDLEHVIPPNMRGLADEFAQSVTGEKLLTAMAYLLIKSAYKEGISLKGNEALYQFEAVLNSHGHSLKAMTHSEIQELLNNLYCGSTSYSSVIGMKKIEIHFK